MVCRSESELFTATRTSLYEYASDAAGARGASEQAAAGEVALLLLLQPGKRKVVQEKNGARDYDFPTRDQINVGLDAIIIRLSIIIILDTATTVVAVAAEEPYRKTHRH